MRTGAGCILVTQGDILHSIFTDGDLRRSIAKNTFDLDEAIVNSATRSPLYIADENMKLVDAEHFFHSGTSPVSCLPVIPIHKEEKTVVGLLVLSDTMKALA